jgi:CheY-like chemotaxis protein
MVVVVDDSAAAVSHYQASARGLEVELRAFRSADAAIGYLRDHHPDLVFLDIVMPEKDGLTLLKELRALPSHRDTPVIVVTSKDYAQDRAVARELGAQEFLLKPLRSREVRALIARYTGVESRSHRGGHKP